MSDATKDNMNGIGDLFLDDSTKPESNWFKFEKVGDSVQGVLAMEPFETEGKFGKQMVYNLQRPDGEEVNVSLKETQKVLIRQLKSAEVGDIIAFRYVGNIDTGKINPAKKIEVRIKHMMRLENDIKNAGL